MDLTDIALRLVGAFYAFAGVVATRAAIMSALLDSAIAKISMEKTPTAEMARSAWLFASAALVFVGGLALAAQIDAAQPLFVVSAIGQAAYLAALAPYYFDRADPPDASGRKGTINAFVLYLAATAFVLWAGSRGKLTAFADAPPAAIAVVATVLAAYFWYLASTVWKTFRPEPYPAANEPSIDDDETGEPAVFNAAAITRVKVMADYGCDPLWSLDDKYWNFGADALDVSQALARDLADWAARYEQSLNQDDPANSHWSDAQFRSHGVEGRALALRLKHERPELEVFVFEPRVGIVNVATGKPD